MNPATLKVNLEVAGRRYLSRAAAACVSAGTLDSDAALAVLKAAGASESYRGLYQAVKEARPIDPRELDRKQIEFREVVALPPTAETMVAVEHTHDQLKLIAAAGWKAIADDPDLDPAHEALLLREHFTELLRTDETKQQPEPSVELIRQTETDAQKLEDGLRGGAASQSELTGMFERITNDCKSCHQSFRDVPLKEKAGRQR